MLIYDGNADPLCRPSESPIQCLFFSLFNLTPTPSCKFMPVVLPDVFKSYSDLILRCPLELQKPFVVPHQLDSTNVALAGRDGRRTATSLWLFASHRICVLRQHRRLVVDLHRQFVALQLGIGRRRGAKKCVRTKLRR